MKAVALCVLAFGAFSAVRAADELPPEEVDQEQVGPEGEGAPAGAGPVADLFGDAANIDWSMFSPQALGMRLNYDEMSQEQLQEVAAAFASLGLIAPEEIEDFMMALQDPRMRRMIKSVSEHWPETMKRVMGDPKYQAFLKEFGGGFDEEALAKIVGLRGGLGSAVKALQDGNN